MNKFIGIGRITKELELKYTTNNKACVNFTIAVDKLVNGEKKADFINCVVWEKQAENLVKYCHKGSKIAIDGVVNTRTYDKDDGSKVYITEIVARMIEFLDSKDSGTKQEAVSPYDYQSEPKEDPFKDFGDNVVIDDNFLD